MRPPPVVSWSVLDRIERSSPNPIALGNIAEASRAVVSGSSISGNFDKIITRKIWLIIFMEGYSIFVFPEESELKYLD